MPFYCCPFYHEFLTKVFYFCCDNETDIGQIIENDPVLKFEQLIGTVRKMFFQSVLFGIQSMTDPV